MGTNEAKPPRRTHEGRATDWPDRAVIRIQPATGSATTDDLLAAVADCEARRLKLLAELKANGVRHAEVVGQLVDAVGQAEAGRLLGVSRQQVWRLARGR